MKKSIIGVSILFVAIIFISCKTEATIIGHWKCDKSGTMTFLDKKEYVTKPITVFYDGFGMPPFEIEFLENGVMTIHNSKTTSRKGGKVTSSFRDRQVSYTSDYDGDKNKVMVFTNDGEDENLVTIKSISSSYMEISWDSIEDDMVMDMRMKRIK